MTRCKTARVSILISHILSRVSIRWHAQRDIVIPFMSVRLSVCPTPVLCRNECIYRKSFSIFCQGYHLVFLSPTAVTKFQGEPNQRDR